jgi:hypothetical protein
MKIMKGHVKLMLLTGMALFGCTSAFGQMGGPSGSIPDLSGIWGRNWFFFEALLSGPVRSCPSFEGRTEP